MVGNRENAIGVKNSSFTRFCWAETCGVGMRARERFREGDVHGVESAALARCSALRLLGRAELPGRAPSVSGARTWARGLLKGLAAAEVLDDVLLLLSELVTNAIVHTDSGSADGLVTVYLAAGGGIVHVEVIDDGSTTSIPVIRKAEEDTDGGRGLWMVDAMATAWGTHLDDEAGGAVWFEIADGAA